MGGALGILIVSLSPSKNAPKKEIFRELFKMQKPIYVRLNAGEFIP